VHPLPEAYEELASRIENDILLEGVKYINPPKEHHSSSAPKKPRTDLACSRQGWVKGCSAALPRRDTERTGSGSVRTGCAGSHKNSSRGLVGNRARGSAGNRMRAGTGCRLAAMGGGAVIEIRPFLSHKSVTNGFSFFSLNSVFYGYYLYTLYV
jgi:hypothetical protein